MFKTILGAAGVAVRRGARGESGRGGKQNLNMHLGPFQFLSPFGPDSLATENRDAEVTPRDSAEYEAPAFLPAGRRAKIEWRNNFSPVGR